MYVKSGIRNSRMMMKIPYIIRQQNVTDSDYLTKIDLVLRVVGMDGLWPTQPFERDSDFC